MRPLALLLTLAAAPLAAQSSACPAVVVRPLHGAAAECASRAALGDSIRVANAIADHLVRMATRPAAEGGGRTLLRVDTLASPWDRVVARALRARAPVMVAEGPDSLHRGTTRLSIGHVERRGDTLGVQLHFRTCTGESFFMLLEHWALGPQDTALRRDLDGTIATGHGPCAFK